MEWVLRLEGRSDGGDVHCFEVGKLARPMVGLTADEVGLSLEEAKAVLAAVQRCIVQSQIDEPVVRARVCSDCGRSRRIELFDPTTHNQMRGNGKTACFGWPTSARLEELRDASFDTPDLSGQQRLCRELQMQAWQDVPFIPLGQFLQLTACRNSITGVLKGAFALFHNVRRAA